MNVVAQEGVSVNSKAGGLVLSSGAGCSDLFFKDSTIIDDPLNIEETTDALEKALLLSHEERARRLEAMRSILKLGSTTQWIEDQIRDAREVASGRKPQAPSRPMVADVRTQLR
jgi:trehalose 6-phosphate synthase